LLVGVAVMPILPAYADHHPSRAIIDGTAVYRERIALSPNAVFEAALLDVSRVGTPSEAIAQVRLVRPGQVPIRFQIAYDARRIDPARHYVVRASIREGGHVVFATDRAYPVLTRGRGRRVSILLQRVGAPEVREPERSRRHR
jgi:putative lipoprotein